MFRPGLDHNHPSGHEYTKSGWVLSGACGACDNYSLPDGIVNRQRKLKVGDRIGGVLGPGSEGRATGWVDQVLCERCAVWVWFREWSDGPVSAGSNIQNRSKVTLLPDAQRPAGFEVDYANANSHLACTNTRASVEECHN